MAEDHHERTAGRPEPLESRGDQRAADASALVFGENCHRSKA
jgi:hypothetical protein